MTTTRRRLIDCPPQVVQAATELLGAHIISEQPAPAGFTRAVASLVSTESTTLFIKAAPEPDSQAIRNAVVLAEVTPTIAPALVDWVDLGTWTIAAWRPVNGATVAQWRQHHVAPLIDLLARCSALLDPAPLPQLTPWATHFRHPLGTWGRLYAGRPGPGVSHLDTHNLPTTLPLSTLAALESNYAEVALTGNALLHGDLRTDNFIATTNGQLYLVDWTNLISGPAWIDLATLLPELARSGLDAMDVWRRSPWADTPPHHLDVMLAAMAGYWYNAGARPPIPHAPGLRTLQQVQAKSALKLLEQRLGSYQRPSRSANSYTPK